MINLIKDFINYFNLKINEKNFSRGFFVENKYLVKYLEHYISSKKSLIISFESIDPIKHNEKNIYVFSTNFFRQIVFLTIRLKYFYATTPGLNKTIFQKSKSSNCKYIYIQHSPVGLINAYNHDAFIDFDAVQVINNFQLNDLKIINKTYKRNIKTFKSKYSLFNKFYNLNNNKINILIAPSWNTGFFENNYHKILFKILSNHKANFSIRPHPMSYIKNEISKSKLLSIGYKIDENVDLNFNNFNILISDWSGIFIEFSFFHKKKAHLINTPKKLLNKFLKDDYVSFEEFSRNEIANTYDENSLHQMINNIFNISNEQIENDKKAINKFFHKFFFN